MAWHGSGRTRFPRPALALTSPRPYACARRCVWLPVHAAAPRRAGPACRPLRLFCLARLDRPRRRAAPRRAARAPHPATTSSGRRRLDATCDSKRAAACSVLRTASHTVMHAGRSMHRRAADGTEYERIFPFMDLARCLCSIVLFATGSGMVTTDNSTQTW